MNCKPGDLAFIRRCRGAPALAGRLVDVLHLAPAGVTFRLPTGKSHEPVAAERWVCRLHGSPVAAPMESGGFNVTHYLPVPDYALCPIRDPGDDAQDESLSWLPAPSASKEVA